MRKLFSVFLIFLLAAPVYAAEGPSPEEAGANIISKGWEMILRSAADAINSIWADGMYSLGLDENISSEYGATRASLMEFMTINPEPQNIPEIAEFEKNSYYTWGILVVIFIFGMATATTIAKTNYQAYSKVLGERDLSEERFIWGSVMCIIAYFTPYYVLATLDLCTVISQYAMMNVLDYIEPSLDNAYMYFFMSLVDLGVAVFFIIRPWIIVIVYAASRILGVWYFSGFWHEEITWIWNKYHKIVSLQVVSLFIACGCLICIKWIGWEDGAGGYIIMFLLIAYINYKWMFSNWGLGTVTKAGKVAILRRG